MIFGQALDSRLSYSWNSILSLNKADSRVPRFTITRNYLIILSQNWIITSSYFTLEYNKIPKSKQVTHGRTDGRTYESTESGVESRARDEKSNFAQQASW